MKRMLALLLMFTFAVSCTTQRSASKGDEAVQHRNWDAAVYHYLQALAEDPDNVEYKLNLTFARQKSSARHFQRGTMLRELGRLKAARDELQMAVQLDPTNQFAEQLLQRATFGANSEARLELAAVAIEPEHALDPVRLYEAQGALLAVQHVAKGV